MNLSIKYNLALVIKYNWDIKYNLVLDVKYNLDIKYNLALDINYNLALDIKYNFLNLVFNPKDNLGIKTLRLDHQS